MRTTFLGVFTALFIGILPFLVSGHLFYGAENLKFFFLIGFVDLTLLWTAYSIWGLKRSFSPKGKWFLYATLLVLLVEYLATAFGVDITRSLWSDILRSTGVLFITHIILAVYLLGTQLKEGDWSLIRKTVALSAAVFSFFVFIGIDGFGLTGKFLWFGLNVSGSTIANTTFAGAYVVLALILGLIELSRKNLSSEWRYGLIGSLLMILISPLLINTGFLFGTASFSDLLHSPSLLLGSARSSSAVAYGLLIFMGGILLLKKLPPKLARVCAYKWAFLWVLAITAGLALLFTPGSFVQKEYIKASTAARIIVWEDAWKGIQERPLLGWGPENFVYVFDRHFDNRLYLEENQAEVWFDRAHNVFVDTLSGSGFLGVLSFALLVLALWGVVFRAHKKGLIGSMEAVLLVGLPIAHIVQNQTAFDTTATYALLAIIGGYLFWLEQESGEGKKITFGKNTTRGFAIVLVALSLVSAKFLLLDEFSRQNALFRTFELVNNPTDRLAAIDASLSGEKDFEILRLSSGSFIKGFVEQLKGQALTQQGFTEAAKQLLNAYDLQFQAFLALHPDHYRARIDYVHLLFMKTMIGDNNLKKAKAILKDSYALAPENPLTYDMDALADVYAGNFDEAIILADKAIALNPDIPLSKRVRAYIDEQKKSFPEITILELENI